MINSMTKYFDFRLLVIVHDGGLLDHCDLELDAGGSWRKVWFLFFWSLTGSCIPWLTFCCWVQVVVVRVEVELRAWSLVGFSMLYTWVANCLLKNLAFSGLNLDWLLCSSWWAPSPGCWLVWCGWGSAWGLGSVGLDWHRNRVCQNVVSHLVIGPPSILVVY